MSRVMMRWCRGKAAWLLAAMLLAPAVAAAVDVTAEVLKLLKGNVEEQVLLTYIAGNDAPGDLNADQIIELKKAGATSAVLMALMKGGGSDFPFDLTDEHTVGKPVQHAAMAVYPVLRKGPVSVSTYLTLDEATDAKTIAIAEQGDGAVPVVVISNNGKLPVYISAGEVIYGGKQDRMIAYDVIVDAGKKLTVEVRCVEQGRWSGRNQDFASSKAMGGKRSRAAAQFKQQHDVWNEVAAQNSTVDGSAGTTSYKASLTKIDEGTEYAGYAGALMPALTGRNVVGMVVAIDGKVESIDIFGGPGLFEKLREKLLKAAVLDATSTTDEGKSAPGREAILQFYRTAMAADSEELKAYSGNRNAARKADHADTNENFDNAGKLLHRSLLAH